MAHLGRFGYAVCASAREGLAVEQAPEFRR